MKSLANILYTRSYKLDKILTTVYKMINHEFATSNNVLPFSSLIVSTVSTGGFSVVSSVFESETCKASLLVSSSSVSFLISFVGSGSST